MREDLGRFLLSAEPEIDWLHDFDRRERQVDGLARTSREISGVDRLQDGFSVFGGYQWLLVPLHAIGEVLHLLREAVVPALLIHGEGPAHRRLRLLDRVAVPGVAVGRERRPTQEVGAGVAARAVDLGPVVDTTAFGPGILGQADPAIESQDAQCVILAASLVAMYEGAHRRGDLFDR